MNVGPFVLAALDDVDTTEHAATLRTLMNDDWPWHVLMSGSRRRIRIRAAPPDRWWWAGIYIRADQTATISTDRDVAGVIAHEVGHAVDHLLLDQDGRTTVREAWYGDPDVSWGGGGLPHRERPSEAFANWFAWRVGLRHTTSYGPHVWADVDVQQAIEEVVMTAAAKVQVFEDVPAGSVHAEGIHWAAGRGLVSGFEDGTFRPDVPVTRGQLATILHRQGGGPDG